nr:MAG TPA: hypothetical protein [Caudoviricetes sp.]
MYIERKEQIYYMAKQLNVSLSFTADANAAKREIQSLK